MTIIQNFHHYTLYTPVVQTPQTHVAMVPPLFAGLLGLPAEEDVDLLLYPVFVVGLVCLSISTVTAEETRNVSLLCGTSTWRTSQTINCPQVYEVESGVQKVGTELGGNCYLANGFILFSKKQLSSRSDWAWNKMRCSKHYWVTGTLCTQINSCI